MLRALAVLLVLGRHYLPLPGPRVDPTVRWVVMEWYQGGWIGVDLFFVLSGFLVSGLLFSEYRRHRGLRPGRFLIRRGFKIYPAFWTLLLVTYVTHRWLGTLRPTWWERCRNELLYLQNYWGGWWNHTWSLGVEEHFYFALPVILLALIHWRRAPDPFRPLVIVIPLLGAGALAWRIWTTAHYPYDHGTHLFPTHLRADTLFWGVLLAYAYHFRDRAWLEPFRRWWPVSLLAAGVLAAPAWIWELETSKILPTAGLTTIAWASVVLVILAIAPRPEQARPAWRRPLYTAGSALAIVGVHSYSIYLWHMPVVRWVLPALDQHGLFAGRTATSALLLRYAAYVAITVLGGVVLSKLVERPMLALRDRYFPSHAA